jgi:hypothetical protein
MMMKFWEVLGHFLSAAKNVAGQFIELSALDSIDTSKLEILLMIKPLKSSPSLMEINQKFHYPKQNTKLKSVPRIK